MYQKKFSHIYIEKEAKKYPDTNRILSHFQGAELIEIRHYKDLFCRKHQDFAAQKKSQSLILAVSKEKSVYKGAPVCQNFGNEYFYYCSNVKNCLFDCEYCYLQGMYASGNIVIFVNLEDIFLEVDALLKKHPVYLCISYDTDLLALEGITGFLEQWSDYCLQHKNLTVEIRTKSAVVIEKLAKVPNFIFAWTLSPAAIIKDYEHGTASLEKRIQAVNQTIWHGGRIHLCFDPILYYKEYQIVYGEMFEDVCRKIELSRIEGISVGTFRISKSYLKNMRKQRLSPVTVYPYECRDGVYQYEENLEKQLIEFAVSKLSDSYDKNKIFLV